MAAELLEKIPPEKRWAITTQALWRFLVLRGEKLSAPLMGTGKDIFSPLWIQEKWYEINEKIFADAGIQLMQFAKETFNIPVENAIEAAKLQIVVATLLTGPELPWGELPWFELVEATPERAVLRAPKFWGWGMYDEYEVEPEFRPCKVTEQAAWPEGHKAINPKITYTVKKMLPWGDPYCEAVIEFKDE